MHEKKALRGINPGFALDHMEPMRPVVDQAVLQLIDAVTLTDADFLIQHDAVCRMNPELARRVAQLALERCEVVRNARCPPRLRYPPYVSLGRMNAKATPSTKLTNAMP